MKNGRIRDPAIENAIIRGLFLLAAVFSVVIILGLSCSTTVPSFARAGRLVGVSSGCSIHQTPKYTCRSSHRTSSSHGISFHRMRVKLIRRIIMTQEYVFSKFVYARKDRDYAFRSLQLQYTLRVFCTRIRSQGFRILHARLPGVLRRTVFHCVQSVRREGFEPS